jgi:hypothetical protein
MEIGIDHFLVAMDFHLELKLRRLISESYD